MSMAPPLQLKVDLDRELILLSQERTLLLLALLSKVEAVEGKEVRRPKDEPCSNLPPLRNLVVTRCSLCYLA